MSDFEKNVIAPAKEWCLLAEAMLWIRHGQIPIPLELEIAFPGRTSILQVDMRDYGKPAYVLYDALCKTDRIKLSGRPATKGARVEFKKLYGDQLPATMSWDAEWGEPTEIPRERIKEAGFGRFVEACSSSFLTDGRVYPTPELPETAWVYRDVYIDFRALSEQFPHPEVGVIRFETEMNSSLPFLPEENRTQEVYKKGKGRPPREDWLLIVALAAIVCEREGGGEIRNLSKFHDRVQQIMEKSGHIWARGINFPVRSSFEQQVAPALARAQDLYEKGK